MVFSVFNNNEEWQQKMVIGSMQDYSISSNNALEIPQACTKTDQRYIRLGYENDD